MLVFSVMLVTGVLTIADINTNYNKSTSTSQFSDVYNTTSELYQLSLQQKNSTLNTQLSSTDPISSAVTGSYTAIRFAATTLELFVDLIEAIGRYLGVPGYFILAAIVAIIISFVFALIYLFITRYVGQD